MDLVEFEHLRFARELADAPQALDFRIDEVIQHGHLVARLEELDARVAPDVAGAARHLRAVRRPNSGRRPERRARSSASRRRRRGDSAAALGAPLAARRRILAGRARRREARSAPPPSGTKTSRARQFASINSRRDRQRALQVRCVRGARLPLLLSPRRQRQTADASTSCSYPRRDESRSAANACAGVRLLYRSATTSLTVTSRRGRAPSESKATRETSPRVKKNRRNQVTRAGPRPRTARPRRRRRTRRWTRARAPSRRRPSTARSRRSCPRPRARASAARPTPRTSAAAGL